jgi:methionyl-tRNA synthetase
MNFNRLLVTAALPYANGPVHIGHLAGCFLPSDIYVRFQRAMGRDVKFVCGSDEHGVPITIRAMKEGISPQQVVDKYHALIRDSFAEMNISFDVYSRTSTKLHRETSQAFFKKLYDAGVFEEKESEQYFDPEKNVFLADRYIVGTCPVCGNPGAYGDQCERCGSTLSPEQLINPKSALSDAVPIKKLTKHWYFPLNKYEDWLREWIVEGKKDEWKVNVYGQCKSWLDAGLQPRAMTRDGSWGVPVPIEGAEGKVLYVWFDAPIGYISATKELTPMWSDYWQKDDTKLVHFIGKDNIVFHCIIFPAMLKAHGGYVLPEAVPANEFLNIEGEKVSTSRNWAVWVHEYLEDFPEGQDLLRYVLCANAPETKDNDFTWKDFQTRINSELAANLGNFVNRAMVMMHKLCNGRVPTWHPERATEADRELITAIQDTKYAIESSLENYRFRDALAEVMALSAKGNKFLQEGQPWQVVKRLADDPSAQELIDNCIHLCLQLCANLAIYLNPFLPTTAGKICHMLKVVDKMLLWENAGKIDLLKQNYPLRAPEILFRKIEDSEIEAQVQKLHTRATKPNTAAAPAQKPEASAPAKSEAPAGKPEISFDDFAKLELRAGTVRAAEKVEKADKLLKLQVDMGNGELRTIVSGIALHFSPEEVTGRQVTVVANLAPRKMRGIESAGMILMAEDANGKLVFVSPEHHVPEGMEVK